MTTQAMNARTIVESALYQQVMVERDRLRDALVHIRARHYHDDHGCCVICGENCLERGIADEALRPALPDPRQEAAS